jgi:hypothetical protein
MSANRDELPLLVKAYEFLAWLTPLTNHFPRAHRHTVTHRLLKATLDFIEHLLEANHRRGAARLDLLEDADAELDKVRFYLRLAHHWRWMTPGQYEHGSRRVAEMGRLLGGWQKLTRQQA